MPHSAKYEIKTALTVMKVSLKDTTNQSKGKFPRESVWLRLHELNMHICWITLN